MMTGTARAHRIRHPRLSSLALLAVGIATVLSLGLTAGLLFASTAAAEPSVIAVPGPAGTPQPTYNGHATLLKAISRDSNLNCGDAITYWRWDLQGSEETTTPAAPPSDPTSKTASKEQTLTPAADGTTRDGTVTAHYENGAEPSDTCQLIHKGVSKDVDIEKSVLEGLWFLHQNQTRYDEDGQRYGYWGSPGSEVAPTARAILVLEVQGHLPGADPDTYAYSYAVERGLNHLLARLAAVAIGPQPAGDPDSNGNGIGLSCLGPQEMTDQPLILTALAASLDPGRVATVGGAGVAGRTYRDIAQDMVEYIAWAQNEDPGPGGAWGTGANLVPSRNSVSQYPILALLAAEENLGIAAPAWVGTELEPWLTYSQNTEPGTLFGGFGDTGPADYPNIDKTGGAGLVGHAYLGTSPLDPRVTSAIAFIDTHWSDTGENLGNYYAMYSTQKGARSLQPEVKYVGSHDWFEEYSDYLIENQGADGGWPIGPGTDRLGSTTLSCLVLTPSVFEPRPVAVAGADRAEIVCGEAVRFSHGESRHTDPRRTITKYEWDFDGDGTFDHETADPSEEPTHAYSPDPSECPKSYLARLRVTDDGGRTRNDCDTVEVIVYAPPEILDMTLTSPEPGGTIYEGDEIEMAATLDYPDYMEPTATIDWGDGSPPEPCTITHNSTATARALHKFTVNTTGTAHITVMFNPSEVSIKKSVEWKSENKGPKMEWPPSVEPTPPVEGSNTKIEVPFADAGAADTHTAIIDWGDGTPPEPAGVASEVTTAGVVGTLTATHVYADDGTKTATVTVTDNDGDSDAQACEITVANVAPTITHFDPGSDPFEGQVASVAGTVTDPGADDTHTARVEWGDGTPDSFFDVFFGSFEATHTYTSHGSYTATCTVTDKDGDSDAETAVITVLRWSAPGHIYVDAARGSDTTGTGSNEAPYKSVTKGMTEATADTTVQVARGVYSAPATSETFPIELKSSVVLQGAGSEETTLSGTGACEVVRADGVNASATIDGFAITGGGGGGGGGGIVCVDAHPTISGNHITGNSSNNAGGIMVTGASSPAILENTVTANTGVWGGGIYVWNAPGGTIKGNWIEGNSATEVWSSGGGIRAQGGAPTIDGNTIRDNWATNGGGLAITDGDATVTNNVVCDNAGQRCGGIYLSAAGAPTSIVGNTIAGNTSNQSPPGGSGILREATFGGTISNCIVWNNTSAGIVDDLQDVSATYSDISTPDDTAGAGNISADPLFVDEAAGDYNLSPGSPCIDSANPATSPDHDRGMISRPQDGDGNGTALPDMGAHEPPHMSLNRGAAYTHSLDVTITSFFDIATAMRYSVDGGPWSMWGAYAPSLKVWLPATEGTHTVDVDYRYNIIMVKRCSDRIYLDLSPAARLTGSASLVSYGGGATLACTLETSAGVLANRGDVTLWRKASGAAAWTQEATATYDATGGAYTAKTICACTTAYQMRFNPASTYASAVSNDVTILARCYLPRPWLVRSTPTRNRIFYVFGYLKPRHYGYNVRLYFYRYVRRRWRYVALRYARSYNWRTYTRYRLLYRLRYPGRYRVRAYHRDAGHVATWSVYRYFRVR